jgi:hypothetical protein
MNVKELKQILEKVPDNAVILLPGYDHSYNLASVELSTAMFKDGDWLEDHGDTYTPEGPVYGSRRTALIIRP